MLIDDLLPIYDVREQHVIVAPGSPSLAYAAVRKVDLNSSRVTRLLFRLRGLPSSALSIQGLLELGFTELAETSDQELVLGAVGQFWKPRGSLRTLSREEFRSFEQVGFGKAAWNIAVGSHNPGTCIVSTETRVRSFGRAARVLFTLYWLMIRPFSGLIRVELLKAIRASLEPVGRGQSG